MKRRRPTKVNVTLLGRPPQSGAPIMLLHPMLADPALAHLPYVVWVEPDFTVGFYWRVVA